MTAQYAHNISGTIIELGTQEGHAALFPSAKVPEDAARTLKALFGQNEMTLKFTTFQPEYLSVVALVDKEQQLKSYFQSDEADKKIGSGALRLARAFTDKIAAESPVQLVINISSPLIQKLIKLDNDKAKYAARMMLSSARMLGTKKALGEDGFNGAMKEFSENMITLLGDENE
jgi:molecular chaperone HtpG